MQTRLVARSGGKPTLMSSGGAAMVAKPRGGSSGLRLCVPCFYDSDAPHCSPSEHAPLSIRLRSALPAFRSRPPRSKDHALVRTDHLRPQSQASRANVMNVAERRRGDFGDSSRVRTHAQTRAEIESPRARGPYMAGCEISSATVLRTAALRLKRQRSLVAYGQRRAQSGPHRSYANDYVPNASTCRTHDPEFPPTLGFSTDEPSVVLPSVPPLKKYTAPTIG